ncbi:MAG TPA: outer membrane beta-barrel family protein, partial [Flavisolibacter sp.]
PTYLNGAELSMLLNGMSASQISQVELMSNPPAKYDAAGNAGVINIKTKKSYQRGFQGTATASYGQGYYPKSNNNISLNYRSGKWNFFTNYSYNLNHYFTRIYALRTYFKSDGINIASLLEQPSFLKGNGEAHNIKAGVDYSITPNTSIGLTIMGMGLHRDGSSNNPARWMQPNRSIDSLVNTISTTHTDWKNLGSNFNFKHNFTSKREISADVDILGYHIQSDQFFENNSIIPGNYSEASKAYIPTEIRILSGKADYAEQIGEMKLEAGWKTSNIRTDNTADYYIRDNGVWRDDYGKSNHFIYNEDIHALYGTLQTKLSKLSLQGGLRYEMTSYDARQLGNALVKDSSFSRNYNSLFPSLSLSYEKDSAHTFSFTTSRRIDRPAFSKLNPFLFIINKYTYQRGNPYYRPQFTWNIELGHLYKNMLITNLSYSITTDYFSQIFPIDSNGIVLYTEGNLGQLQNLGAAIGLQLSPVNWWSFSLQTVLNRKRMQGMIGRNMVANITQYNINLNNQFRFQNGWSGELSGFYNSKSQHDIQEIVDPSGQVSIGVSKSVLNNQGTIKLAVKDLFYTNWMKGLTQFNNATEYFKLTRDTRAGTLSFTWRFGKTFKTKKQSEGASGDEVQRVGNG